MYNCQYNLDLVHVLIEIVIYNEYESIKKPTRLTSVHLWWRAESNKSNTLEAIP